MFTNSFFRGGFMFHKFYLIFVLVLFTIKGFSEEPIEDFFSSPPDQVATLTEASDLLIGGIIHPLSGQPCLRQVDLTAKGAQSLELKRTFIPFYTPLNERDGKIYPSRNSYGGWIYFPHTRLNVFKQIKANGKKIKTTETIVSVSDPQGIVTTYKINQQGQTKLITKPWGISNVVDEHPSGMCDPRNTTISLDKTRITLHAPNGTKRYYSGSNSYEMAVNKDRYACLHCLLEKEILPNGKVLRYSYDDDLQVVKVESMDPNEAHVYATLNIDASLKEKEVVCSTNTGLQATYSYLKKDKQERYINLLYPLRFTAVSTPSFAQESINYHTTSNGDSYLIEYLGKHPIFKCASIPLANDKKDKKPYVAVELSLPSDETVFFPVYFMDYLQGIPGEENSITSVTQSNGIKTVYTFNPKMLPEKISEYDQQGNLVKEKTFAWTKNQWLKSVRITDGKQQLFSEKTFQYDPFGNPISETLTGDLKGNGEIESNEIKRTFSNDGRHLLLSEEYSNGKVVNYTYLPETNLLTSCLIKEQGKSILSREFRYYDSCHNLIQVINDDGSAEHADDLTDVSERKIIYYHLRQQQPFLHMPENIEIKYWEDGTEKLFKKTSLVYDQWGNVVAEHVYDSEGTFAYTIHKEEGQHSNEKTCPLTEKATYDPFGRKIDNIDPNGNKISYQYNLYGSPTAILYPDLSKETFCYNIEGLLVIHRCQNGLHISQGYDILGNITKKFYVYSGRVIGQESFEYKGKNLLRSTDMEGNLTQYAYDGLGRKIREEKSGCITSYQYDALGELAVICQENGENSLYTHFKRDLSGRVLEKRKTDVNGNILSKIAYSYDGNGNIQTIERNINGQESIETFAYDANDRQILHNDAQGNLTTTCYDETQQILTKTVKDPQGLLTVETYNPYGRLVKQEKLDHASQIISAKEIGYDACGNRILQQDHIYKGTDYITTRITKWTYDPCHRISSITHAVNTPEARTTKWSYHQNGNPAYKIMPDGTMLMYYYNALQQLTEVRSSDKKLFHTFTYNRLGHLLEASDELTGLKITREVDPHGNILLEQFSDGVQIKKKYDLLHRPVSMTLPDGSEVVYHYDPLFLKKVERLSASSKTRYEHSYDSYDESGYLLTEHLLADLGTVHHATDIKGQLTSLTSDYFKQEFQYDAVENLSAQVNNEDAIVIYDLRGNIIKKSVDNLNLKFSYDPLDRLVEVESDGKKICFDYDPLGRKISKTVKVAGNEDKESFFYDGNHEIGIATDKGEIRQLRILGACNRIIAIELGTKAYAPLLDVQGNVRVLVDASSKSVAATYNYTALGKQLPSSNRVFNPWQFASKRYDPDSGLIDFGNRFYDPQLGKWLSIGHGQYWTYWTDWTILDKGTN